VQQQRPAFNTNQQHYSPLKSHGPKPLTSSFLAPPSPSKLPANVAISAETSRLQTELLQLSLMHRDVGAVSAEWAASAKQKLGDKFEAVAQESRELTQLEQREAEGHNIAALLRWGGGGGDDDDNDDARSGDQGLYLEDKIQTLEQVLGGIWSLSGGEQYARVTREFESWAEQVADILAAQKRGAAEDLLDESDEVLFVSAVDAGPWKADVPGLVRKLDSWRRMLKGLGRVPPPAISSSNSNATTKAVPQRRAGGTKPHSRTQSQHQQNGASQTQAPQPQAPPSSLEKVLNGCEALIEDMLSELAIMQEIEREALQAENDWILRVNRDLRGEDESSYGVNGANYGDVIATPSATGRDAVPLWKMVL